MQPCSQPGGQVDAAKREPAARHTVKWIVGVTSPKHPLRWEIAVCWNGADAEGDVSAPTVHEELFCDKWTNSLEANRFKVPNLETDMSLTGTTSIDGEEPSWDR